MPLPQQPKPSQKTRQPHRRWLKIATIIVGSLLLLAIVGFMILNTYVENHKQALTSLVTQKIHQEFTGTLTIKSVEPAFLHGFPSIALRLDSVSLTDSLYAEHHIQSVSLQSVFVKLNLFSLFSNQPKIQKITLSNGFIHWFTLKNGYTNSYLVKTYNRSEKAANKPKKAAQVHSFGLQNVRLIISHVPHHKLFKIHVRQASVNLNRQNNNQIIRLHFKAKVGQLGFNLIKGSYLKNQPVRGHVRLIYNNKEKTLSVNHQKLKIAHKAVFITTTFDFKKNISAFKLKLHAPSENFSTVLSLLSENIVDKLKYLKTQKPISVTATLSGGWNYPDTPLVNVRVATKNNVISTPYGTFKNATLTALFNNHLQAGNGKGDGNSGIFIPHLQATWQNMPLQVDSMALTNLVRPYLSAKMSGEFASSKLNQLLGRSFSMTKGSVQFRFSYNGLIHPSPDSMPHLTGFILLRNTDLTYLPRSLKFSNCNATLAFSNHNIIIKNMRLDLAKNTIHVRGRSHHFLKTLLFPGNKAVFDCNLKADKINLNNFIPLLSPRHGYIRKGRRKRYSVHFNQKFDNLIAKSTMILNLHVGQVNYHQFEARKVLAQIIFDTSTIHINKASLSHADGTVTLDATIKQLPSSNNFRLNGCLNGLKIDKLFKAFKDFGQKTLKSKNLKGRLTAKVNMGGRLDSTGKIVSRSLTGGVNFQLKNGELNNFPPFLNISKFIFKHRHLNHVTFQTLSDSLTIDDDKIHIHPMTIHSSAIVISVKGIYAFDTGTNIALKIPLRNPQKEKDRLAEGLPPRKGKGIILYLRAKEDAKGKVHIGWDPLHKGRWPSKRK